MAAPSLPTRTRLGEHANPMSADVSRTRSINLTKNSQHFVRLGDVERLIALGYLQRLD